jgi:hypothetical protein
VFEVARKSTTGADLFFLFLFHLHSLGCAALGSSAASASPGQHYCILLFYCLYYWEAHCLKFGNGEAGLGLGYPSLIGS